MVANTHSTPLKRRKSILDPPIFPNFDEFEEPSVLVAVMTYLSYAVLIVFGHLRDFMTRVGLEKSHRPVEKGNTVSRYLCWNVHQSAGTHWWFLALCMTNAIAWLPNFAGVCAIIC